MAYALITGASSGIGREMAVILASKGYDLLLVARRMERLQEVKEDLENRYNVTVRNFNTDLSADGSVETLFHELREKGFLPEILINNAGFGDYGNFADSDPVTLMRMITVNNTAVVSLAHQFLQDALPNGKGHILNVASLISFFPLPYYTLYGATKAFLLSFSETLREELRGTGINVSVLCPGPTETEFFSDEMRRSRSYRILKVQPAQKVAKAGIDGLLAGKAVIIPGMINRVIALSASFLPRSWARRFSGLISKS